MASSLSRKAEALNESEALSFHWSPGWTGRLLSSVILLALVVCLPATALAGRGRPTVTTHPQFIGTTYATLVSDTGSLLRGPRWSTDVTPDNTWNEQCPMPTKPQVFNLRWYGFNALHVYGESFDFADLHGLNAGYCEAEIQQLVDWTRDAGLYLVLTIGNGPGGNGNYDRDGGFATDFWNYYAYLFKEQTHVIYEIHNEPYFDFGADIAQPSPNHVIEFERDMYKLIRTDAPDTPILLFSYAEFHSGAGVMQDVQALGSTVDWTNAAIAFHGYATTAETEATLNTVVENQIPVVQTEFIVSQQIYEQDVDQTLLYEDRFTSWFTFLDVASVYDDTLYKNPLDQGWVVWPADFGSWPATLAPPIGNTVSLQATVNGEWVSAVNGGADPLRASSSFIGSAEKFQVVASGHPRYVGLKAVVNGKYVSAENAGADFLIASRSSLAWWESFQWMKRPDGKVVLKARANLKIVSNDLNLMNPPQLIANRKAGGPWERYVVTVH